MIRALMGTGRGPDARLTALRNEFYSDVDAARERYGSARQRLEREGLDVARDYYEAAPPMEREDIRSDLLVTQNELSGAQRRRADLHQTRRP